MNRRDFMKGILAAGMAPAFCKAEWMMNVRPLPESGLLVPDQSLAPHKVTFTLSGLHPGTYFYLSDGKEIITRGVMPYSQIIDLPVPEKHIGKELHIATRHAGCRASMYCAVADRNVHFAAFHTLGRVY